MILQSMIKEMHCGLYHCPLVESYNLMPNLEEVLSLAPIDPKEKYVVDVRVSMLMPFQWACIPNWHFDNIPRDHNLQQLMHMRDRNKVMLMWVSGEPLTEFMRNDGSVYTIKSQEWTKFTQYDLHRGAMSTKHTWRIFIRLTPEPLLLPATSDKWLRRHSQVYCDTNNFKW